MRIVGVDPAPKKVATLYDRSSGWETIDAHRLPESLKQRWDSSRLLLCWDAPLTVGGVGHGCYYERKIEAFFRNQNDFTTPKGISVRPFAGCPHWAVTQATLGLPRTGKWSFAIADLPYRFIEYGEPPHSDGQFVVEVHPAVSLWLWCRDRLPNGPWTYKKLKANRELVWQTFSEAMQQKLPERDPRNDDEIDAFIACLLGELWMEKENVILLGGSGTGSFLVPTVDGIAEAFQKFTDSR